MKLDISKIDIRKFDFNDLKILRWIAVVFFLIIILVDICLFPSLLSSIESAKIQREKEIGMVNYFRSVISKENKVTGAIIIASDKMDVFLDEIQGVADDSNVEADIGGDVKTDKKENSRSMYTRKVFPIEVSGSLEDLGVFLTKLRNMRDASLDIEGLDLSGDKKDISKIKAQINVAVLVAKYE